VSVPSTQIFRLGINIYIRRSSLLFTTLFSLRTPECLKSYALYLRVAENGIAGDIAKRGITRNFGIRNSTSVNPD
jgi:hypothetical protein